MTKLKIISRSVATLFAIGIASIHSAYASISVSLEEPDWHFVLKQDFGQGQGKRGKVSREESKFIHTIQPSLSQGNYQQVISAFDSANIENPSASLLELKGQVLLNLKRYQEAENVLNASLKAMPGSAVAHRSLSMVYLLTDRLPEAQIHLVKSIELGAIDAQLYGQLAYVNLQLGKPVTAISAYQHAIMLEPKNRQWYQGLLFAYIESDALPQAENLISELLLEEPNNQQLWLQRGQLALKQANYVKAIASLESALALGDDSLSNLISLVKLHITEGSQQRATDILSTHVSAFISDQQGEGFETISRVANYLSAKQGWQSLSVLLKATATQTAQLSKNQQAQLDVFKAKLALANNQSTSAMSLLQSAVEQLPNNGEALMTLAQLYRDNKNSERAAMYYLRAETLEGFKPQAMLGRAQLAINQRQYPEALTLLRKVYKENPARTDLLSNIQSLENLVRNTL